MNTTLSNQIFFTSKIKFVSDTEFRNQTSNEVRSWSNDLYIGDPWDKAITGPRALTEDIYGCNAGGLTNTNSRDVTMFHFKPAAHKYSEDRFTGAIKDALGKMGQYTEQLGALLIGGKTAGSGDANYSESEKVKNKLLELCDNIHASATKFWGQTTAGGHTNIFYSGEEDTWYVNYQDKNRSYSFETNSNISTPEDIKDAYFEIEVSDNDQVFIGDREIDKFDLKHGFRKIDGGYEFDYSHRNPFYQPQYDFSAEYRPKQKVNLYPANFGQDPTTLWVDSSDPVAINKVIEKIDDIKQAPLFQHINKVQYASTEELEGFTRKDTIIDGKPVFEKQI